MSGKRKEMFEILKKPHPFIFNAYSVVIPSLITFIILVVLAPFQFQGLEIYYRIVYAFIISLIVALGIVVSIKGLQILFPTFISEDKWTVGKEFFLFLFVVLIIVILISIACLQLPIKYTSISALLFKTTSITLSISLLPILISILFEQYRHQKLQLEKATLLTDSLKMRNELLLKKETLLPPIFLKSENKDIVLQLNPEDLIYLKSDGNYVEVYYYNSNEIHKKVIRNRLKTIEHILPNDLFYRCHNRFIINGNHIIKIEGNARNLILHLKGISECIPVSRAKAKGIAAFLENL